jgi:tetratricopeptide (TPR) repeat protein
MYREAMEASRQAISLNLYFAEAHINLGFAYNGLGMYREAIEAYKYAIRIRPDSAEAHYNLGFAYFYVDDRDSALEEYRKLKDLGSQYADELYILISREEAAEDDGVREPFAIRDRIFEGECVRDCDIEVEIFKAEGDAYEFRGKTLPVCNDKMTPFCYGARHTWVGRLVFGGYIFDSDKDDPLRFMVTRDKGYVYIKGKGTVTMPDRTRVSLPKK